MPAEDLNPPNTYVPDLVGKDWGAHGAREIEDALRRLTVAYEDLLLRLAAAGVDLNGDGGPTKFYQQVQAEADGVPVDPREMLSFAGTGVSVDDAGDRTVVTVGGVDSSVTNPLQYVVQEQLAVRDVLAKAYR